ncbi:MAG: lactonase family protein [Spirochaetes bacterium]|nr:lactonase family protein [Spirochaetota bacterium]
MEERIVLVGTYTQPIRFGTGRILEGKGAGIYCFRFDPEAKTFRFISTIETVNPSFLVATKDRRFVYAVNELKETEGQASGRVSAFALNEAMGRLDYLNNQLTWGTDPCFVELDRLERWAVVANFMSGSVSVYPIFGDGSLGPVVCHIQHQGSSVDPARQKGPHAHSVIFDTSNSHVFVPDLGMDRMVAYDFDAATGTMVPNEGFGSASKPGSGPRYMEIHPSGRFAYTVNELDSTVAASFFDSGTETLQAFQTISTLPAGFTGQSSCADLHISPSGRHLYASNRGHDSIAVFAIDANSGELSLLTFEPARGGVPRNFAIDPSGDWILVANQDTDNIVLFAVDKESGLIEFTGTELRVPTPVCVRFA